MSELIDRTEIITSNTKSFLRLSEAELNFKPSPQSWSIVEIYAHLNITNKTYISSIIKKMMTSRDVNTRNVKSGWLASWVYERLMPRADGTVYKASSPKNFCSTTKKSAFKVMNEFLEQQDIMYDILQHASTKDLDDITVPFYYSKLLSFSLGNTLRFIAAHNERHLMQAYQVMEKIPMVQKG